jgi:hypothetical protein
MAQFLHSHNRVWVRNNEKINNTMSNEEKMLEQLRVFKGGSERESE